MKKNQIYRLTLTSLLIAIALVLSLFNYMFYFSGGAGLRISFSSYISVIPSFLFGPLYGGITMGITDILAFLIKPDGAFMLPLTITAIVGGIMRGYLWRFVKGKKIKPLLCIIIFSLITAFGVINYFAANGAGDYSEFLKGFDKKLPFLTLLPIIIGCLSLVFALINYLLKKTKFYSDEYVNVIMVLLPVNIIITTINTILLMIFIPSLGQLAFSMFYIPRLIEEVANTSVQSYVVSYLLKLNSFNSL